MNKSLILQVHEKWKEGKGVEFVDILVDDTTSLCKIMICMHVALLCVQENLVNKPSVLEVYLIIKIEAIVIDTPRQPMFSTNGGEDAKVAYQCRVQVVFKNYVTISQQEPRQRKTNTYQDLFILVESIFCRNTCNYSYKVIR